MITDPGGNDAKITFVCAGNGPCYESKTETFQGLSSGGTKLKTVDKSYSFFSHGPWLPTTETTTWNQQNLVTKVETDWDSFAVYTNSSFPQNNVTATWRNVKEAREYAFGVGTPGTLVRKTHYNYLHIDSASASTYRNVNVADRPISKVVYDGSGNIVAQTNYTYDGTALTSTAGTPAPNHDYTNYGSSFLSRGNLTQLSEGLKVGSTWTWLNTNHTYDDLGNRLSTTDPGGHATSFSYTDSWSGATCSVGANTGVYLTQTSAPDTVNSQSATVHHRTQQSYYACTGLKQSARDENDILAARTGTTFTYDLMNRPLCATNVDGRQTCNSYTDTTNAVSIAKAEKLDATRNITTIAFLDGLGRTNQTQLVDPSDGDTFVDTTYDLLNRVATVSNPHRVASLPTDGITTYQYDALNRKIKEIPPDGTTSSNNVVASYGGQTSGVLGLTTTVTDQAGRQRMSVTDALGRLVQVWEPDPSTGSLTKETLYQYDVLDNLLRVDQKGGTADTTQWRTRTSTYDSLSRLLTTFNPESGTTTWTFDSDSNAVTKKDFRNVTITYNYDQLHRVTNVGSTHAKTYSNGDPAVDYYFDQTSYNGLTITEGVNQRTGMSDTTGQAAWTFDTEGRALSEKKTVNISGLTPSAVTKTLTYAYNKDGSMATLTYPSGHVINYGYNTAGHSTSAIDPSGPVNYVTAATYAPHGAVGGYTNGQAGSFTGIFTTNAWNNRFQPSTFTASTQGAGAHTVMSLSFSFNQGTVGSPINNGLLVKINNGVNTGRNVNYKYDQLNRIVAGWHDATDWGTQYNVDIWGNLTQKANCDNVVCPTRTTADSFSNAVDGNNRFIGYSYDASGNLLNDQLGHTFSYDGENRPYSAGGVTYYYDGEGERVAKSNGKLYLFGTNSAPVVETDTSGNLTAEYIFFNGKRVAMRKADSSVHYYFADQIGSANVVTNATGAMPPEQDIEYHPYGEEQEYVAAPWQQYRFTSKERDAESGNDHFPARDYSSNMGRWVRPDPLPWIDWQHGNEEDQQKFENFLSNPQNLNMYTYVDNNPLNKTDPTGMQGCQAGDKKFTTCTITIVYDPKTSKGTLTVTGQNKGDKDPTVLLTSSVVVGGNGHVTPTGTFTATVWEKDHVSTKYGSAANTPYSKTKLGGNAFGPYQLHMKELDSQGITIHGTMGPNWWPNTWGNSIFLSPSSHGCVRMCNADDNKLHDIMPSPRGNKVIISAQPED